MGTAAFFSLGRGNTPQEAFDTAVADAKQRHGTCGCTGTVAEKRSFHVVRVTEQQLAEGVAAGIRDLEAQLEACRPAGAGPSGTACLQALRSPELEERIANLEARLRDEDHLRRWTIAGVAQELLSGDPRARDAAGPALCLEFCPGEWLFFGYATC